MWHPYAERTRRTYFTPPTLQCSKLVQFCTERGACCGPSRLAPRAFGLCVLQGQVTPHGYVTAVIERIATSQALFGRTGVVTLKGLDYSDTKIWERTCSAGPLTRRVDPSNPATFKWYGKQPCRHLIGVQAARLTTCVTIAYAV